MDMPEFNLSWKLVDDTAAAIGVGESARLKWRQPGRGVPPKWRISISQELMRRGIPVALSDFDDLQEKPGRIAA